MRNSSKDCRMIRQLSSYTKPTFYPTALYNTEQVGEWGTTVTVYVYLLVSRWVVHAKIYSSGILAYLQSLIQVQESLVLKAGVLCGRLRANTETLINLQYWQTSTTLSHWNNLIFLQRKAISFIVFHIFIKCVIHQP